MSKKKTSIVCVSLFFQPLYLKVRVGFTSPYTLVWASAVAVSVALVISRVIRVRLALTQPVVVFLASE